MKMEIDRRLFLSKLTKASMGLVSLKAIGISASGEAVSKANSILREPRIDAFAGEFYLKMFPEERDLDVLTRSIWKADAKTVETFGYDKIRNLLSQAIKSDFQKGNVMDLHGWRMSRSESRFFALQALLIS